MASRLTLTLPPGLGSKEVEVTGKRFSIGRTEENDLPLDDTTLSRRHALIEEFDGTFSITDCGSSNGTQVNGNPVRVATQLQDRDVLTFGGVGDIVVRVRDDVVESASLNVGSAAGHSAYTAAQNEAVPTTATGSPWLSAPVIAVASAVLILFVAGLALVVTELGSQSNRNSRIGIVKKQPPVIENNDNSNDIASPTPSETIPNVNADDSTPPDNHDDTASTELAAIESAASKVLSGISRDTHPVLTEKPLKQIDAQIQRYRSSPAGLRDALRSMKRDIPAVSAIAKSNGLRPPFLIYATLARMDADGGRGEPAQVAAQICPELGKMRKIFGDELANDSLLSLAAVEEGAALQFRITKLAGRVNDSPTTIRSIWYLHEHQVIRDDTYSFVLRFIAIGVISQDPQKFGIAAEPLSL